ncbi:MAG TPA: hypothetical protein DEF51_52295 [Myxococcales bacterium]|nr:hypothetical protein [Myxococcales bacterium]
MDLTQTSSAAPFHLDLRVLRFRSDPKRDEPAMLAQELLSQGRLEEAVELTERTLELDPTDADLLLTHGCALARLGQLETAQLAFTRAAKRDPDWVEPWVQLAEVLLTRGKPARAVQVIERGLAVDARDARLLQSQSRATLELRAHAYCEAPDEGEDPAMLATQLLAGERADLAFEVTRTALLSELDDVDLLVAHAKASRAMGDLDEAISALRTASYEAADWTEIWELLAEAHEAAGENERARDAAAKGLLVDPASEALRALHERMETLVTL